MYSDVTELREFYGSPLGKAARLSIRKAIREVWPDVRGDFVLGMGYATPYLSMYRQDAERVSALMPAAQGVIRWPHKAPGLTTLADETDLPFPDLSVDRILLVHCLEHCERLRPMMRELWRVLKDDGKVLIVVPNRRGLWARAENTPFGQGRPFTQGQMNRLLTETLFTPLTRSRALYLPPSTSSLMLLSARMWERVGGMALKTFGGVNLFEAKKEIYGVHLSTETAKARGYAVAGPVANPRTVHGLYGRRANNLALELAPAQKKDRLLTQ